jgi:predicted DNA-binding transcriptional regulator YafY
VVKEGKNKTTFSLDVLISEELIRSFLSFGGELEVLEPSQLRQQIRERVIELANRYEL